MAWLMPAIISHETLQREPEETLSPWKKMGPTPFATVSDQISRATIPAPHATDETKKGFLNRSGRMKRKGIETTQNTMKPMSS